MKQNPSAIESKNIARRRKGTIKAKSEFFRSARYGLTLQEHRVVYYAILAGQQDGKSFEPVTLSIKAFQELFEVAGNDYYREIRNLSNKLIGKSVEIVYKDEKGQYLIQAPWLKSIKYVAKDGSVIITPNEELKPFFEGKPFSSTEFRYLINFSSQYAERLYEILKSLDHKTIVDFDPEDIAKRLKAPPSCQSRYNNFRARVLDPAIKDINEYTDLEVELRERHGQRNKVTAIFFSIAKKKAPKLPTRSRRAELSPPLSDKDQDKLMEGLLGDETPARVRLESTLEVAQRQSVLNGTDDISMDEIDDIIAGRRRGE
ncbi:MAG TPA: hypothetical protein DEQ02_02450 [Ruminococcaceae bacterium]|nr:hypothetical protein [Oscillospiraceae bacterium]